MILAPSTAYADPAELRLQAMNYAEHKILDRGDGWVLATASEKQSGYVDHIMLHDIPPFEPAVVITGETLDGRYGKPTYGGRVFDNVSQSSKIRSIICKTERCSGSLSVSHYFMSYIGVGTKNQHSSVSAERGAFSTLLKGNKDTREIYAEKLYPNENAVAVPDMPYRFCIAEQFRHTQKTVDEIIQICGGDNPFLALKDRGIAYAKSIVSSTDYDIYVVDSAELNGTNTHFSHERLFVETKRPHGEKILTEELANTLATLGQQFELSMPSQGAVYLTFNPKDTLHPLFNTSYEANGKRYLHRTEPAFLRHIGNWKRGVGLANMDKEWKINQFFDHNPTINEILKRHDRIAATRAAQDTSNRAKYSEQERYDLLVASAKRMAQRYGYVYFDEVFFGRNNQPDYNVESHTGLEFYLNGAFKPSLAHQRRADFRTLLLTYVYTYSEICAAQDPDFLWPYTVQSTTQRIGANGEPLGPVKITGERDVRLQIDVRKAWEEVFDEEEHGVGKYQRAAQGISALRDIWSGRSRFSSALDFAETPAKQVKWLIDEQGCSSEAVTQLKSNLVRAAQGLPSIQSARLNINGERISGPGSSDAKLLYEHYEPGLARVDYVYAETPSGWRPNNPDALLAQAREHYGVSQNHHLMGEIPLMITLTDSRPESGSLRAMRYLGVGVIDNESETLADIGYKLNTVNHERSLDQNEAVQLAVSKHYRDFVESHSNKMLVECEYQNGQSILYWLDTIPGVSPAMWRQVHPRHPLAMVKPPMKNCPTSAG